MVNAIVGATGYVLMAVFCALLLGALLSWCFAAYYLVKAMRRWHPERRWGQFLPVSLFTPWFFTAEGNAYRVKALRWSALFLIFVALGFGFGAIGHVLVSQLRAAAPSNVVEDLRRSSGKMPNPALQRTGQRRRFTPLSAGR
jgi:hypothetical protein